MKVRDQRNVALRWTAEVLEKSGWKLPNVVGTANSKLKMER
jgi:hypothetical protein